MVKPWDAVTWSVFQKNIIFLFGFRFRCRLRH